MGLLVLVLEIDLVPDQEDDDMLVDALKYLIAPLDDVVEGVLPRQIEAQHDSDGSLRRG
jgi:hypothetical protein